jgi:hypothetical protein
MAHHAMELEQHTPVSEDGPKATLRGASMLWRIFTEAVIVRRAQKVVAIRDSVNETIVQIFLKVQG